MRLSHTPAFVAIALAISLSGCDESTSSPLASPEAVGAVSFRLSSADSSALVGTVDSVLLRAIAGHDTESVRGPLGTSLVISGLPEGPCSLEAFLFGKDGTLRWSGHDTVRVRSGEETPATLVLHKAAGSVRVTVVLDSSVTVDSSFALYSLKVHPDYPANFFYTLDARGAATLVRQSHANGAEVFDTTRVQLSASAFARVRALLESAAARHPGTIPERTEIDTIIQGGDTSFVKDVLCGASVLERTITYANGTTAISSLNYNTQDESINWSILNPVDSLLEASLPMRSPQYSN